MLAFAIRLACWSSLSSTESGAPPFSARRWRWRAASISEKSSVVGVIGCGVCTTSGVGVCTVVGGGITNGGVRPLLIAICERGRGGVGRVFGTGRGGCAVGCWTAGSCFGCGVGVAPAAAGRDCAIVTDSGPISSAGAFAPDRPC